MEKQLVQKIFDKINDNLDNDGTTSDLKNLADVYVAIQGIIDMKKHQVSPETRR